MNVSRSTISGKCFFGGVRISIGEDTFVNYGVFFDNAAPIVIGRRVQLGPEVMILTGTHEIGDQDQRAGLNVAQSVSIGDGAWVGARATIMPGVTIGPGCIVATGAVVIRDCKANTLYAGVPARAKGPLESAEYS